MCLFAQVLLLFEFYNPGGSTWTENYAFVQYLYITTLIDDIDNVVNRVCFCWATADDGDHIIDFNSLSQNEFKIGDW